MKTGRQRKKKKKNPTSKLTSLLKKKTGPPFDLDAQAHLYPCPHPSPDASFKLHHFPLLGNHHCLLLAVWPPLLRLDQHRSEFRQSPEPSAVPRLSEDRICCYSRLCVELVPRQAAHRGLGDGESLRGVAGDGTGEACESGSDRRGFLGRGEQADGRECVGLALLGNLRLISSLYFLSTCLAFFFFLVAPPPGVGDVAESGSEREEKKEREKI